MFWPIGPSSSTKSFSKERKDFILIVIKNVYWSYISHHKPDRHQPYEYTRILCYADYSFCYVFFI